mmetsp:Transcript_43547/g.70593  ORF Transcript_43547/g.70593 Transcript_43547/m.70593 type:complete len:223 (+) Transcript_43547:139-807(+)
MVHGASANLPPMPWHAPQCQPAPPAASWYRSEERASFRFWQISEVFPMSSIAAVSSCLTKKRSVSPSIPAHRCAAEESTWESCRCTSTFVALDRTFSIMIGRKPCSTKCGAASGHSASIDSILAVGYATSLLSASKSFLNSLNALAVQSEAATKLSWAMSARAVADSACSPGMLAMSRSGEISASELLPRRRFCPGGWAPSGSSLPLDTIWKCTFKTFKACW